MSVTPSRTIIHAPRGAQIQQANQALTTRRMNDITKDMQANIPRDRLMEVLDYDRESGIFRWRVRPTNLGRVKAGDIAGTVENSNGHRYIRFEKRDYIASRLAWLFIYGECPVKKLKFIDGDSRNIRINNLTPARCSGVTGVDSRDRAAYEKAHRKANPDYYADYDLRRDFGISLAQYNEMLKSQGGVCAICEQTERTTRNGKFKRLAVDHDHVTGKIRGLLCAHCNHAIGKLGDDPALIRKAAEYVERNRKNAEVIPFRPKLAVV